ncbi:MAG: citryl-CoA lyase [Chloroflexota bacterium]
MPEEKEPFHWRTAISYKTRDRIVIRGYDLSELLGRLNFGEMMYLVWKGELPTRNQGLMLNAMLVATTEHAFSPSSVATRFVAAGGTNLQASVVAGILSFGEAHGSAHRAAQLLQTYVERSRREGKSIREVADELVRENKIVSGLHHPQHIKDPRPPILFRLAEEYGVVGDHVRLAQEVEEAFERVRGKRLYVNEAGAVGAICSDLGFHWEVAAAVMFLARAAGCVAHAEEERERERGWRATSTDSITQPLDLALQLPQWYDGPAERRFPTDRG